MRRTLSSAALLLLLCLLLTLPASSLSEKEKTFSEEGTRQLLITEIMASNGTWVSGHAYDWVEIYNPSKKSVNLSGYCLSDSKKQPGKWVFPEGSSIKGGSYLIVYCTGEDQKNTKTAPFYASFKLSASGDDIILTGPDGTTVHHVTFPQQFGNVSFGKARGSDAWGYFWESTPGKANEKTVYATRAATPRILTEGGKYEESVTVFCEGDAGDTLRYTLDGATPSSKSKVFPAEGLTVSSTASLRVSAFRDGAVPSQSACATYLIDEDIPVAVVCLTTDDKYFFGSKAGALVKGTGSVPNYDKPYEYPCHIEYFDEEGQSLINQMGSFTASGHSARQNAQKSIAIYARKVFGESWFAFNPFPHRDYSFYKSLLLRSTNSDAYSERLRDVVFSSLAEPLSLCYQDARPIVVFLNGEYWGHYNLREKINKYMVAQWENIPLEDSDTVDQIDILARTGSDQFLQNGDNADWLELCDFCKKQDLLEPDSLQYVLDRLDVNSLFEHASFEIISGNSDITNVRMYRVPGGKWKYLLFDVEASFGSGSDTNVVPLDNYIKSLSAKIQAFRHEPLNALLKVPEMKDQFLKTFARVLDSCFTWPYVEAHFAPWEEVLEQLLPRHNQRWPYLTMKRWRTNVSATKYYARVRPKKIVSMLQKRMKLTSEEVETYFGDVQRKLEDVNTLK